MNKAKIRIIVRWIHLVFTIPILGYIYSPVAEIESYGPPTRYIFVPVLMLSGYWMYAGAVFAILGVAAWLGANHLFGFGAAVLSQVVLLIARKVWLLIRARKTRQSASRQPTIPSEHVKL
jgi:hypothetical protein